MFVSKEPIIVSVPTCLVNSEFGEECLSFLIGHAGVNNDIITLPPVHRCGDTMLVTELQRVDDTDDLVLIRDLVHALIHVQSILTKLRPVDAG